MTASRIHIRHETNELRLLFEVCRALEATGDLGTHMESILRFMTGYTAMLWGGIVLCARGNIARPGYSPALPGRYGFWLSRIPPGCKEEHPVVVFREAVETMVFETGLPVAVREEAADPMALHRGNLRGVHKEEVRLFAVPLLQGEVVLGAIFADRLFADSVAAEEDVRLLQAIASLVARALVVRLEFEARHSAVMEENKRLRGLLSEQSRPCGMEGGSAALPALPLELPEAASSNVTAFIRDESGSLDRVLGGVERRMITDALAESGGNMAKASARLGITERIMGLRMKKYGLRFKDFRGK